jgi:hypothetical protein
MSVAKSNTSEKLDDLGGEFVVMWCIFVGSTLIMTLATLAFIARATEFSTTEQAIAEATFAAITDQARQFRDRDLSVYILDYDCAVQTHAARNDLVGESLWEFRDQYGVYPASNKEAS